MAFIRPSTNIDFMGMRKVWIVISILLTSWCLYEWIITGQNKFGIDFLGGTDVVVSFEEEMSSNKIREALLGQGVQDSTVQAFESSTFGDSAKEYSIRLKGTEKESSSKVVKDALNTIDKKYSVLREDFVGPIIGEKIKSDGFKAIAFAIIGLLIYISYKFEFVFAVGAVISLAHDIFMAAGIFLYFGGEIGASVLAALLTILGYSVNDTIIVYDRIRENLALRRSGKGIKVGDKNIRDFKMADIINLSVNQTLSRTILTSGTTLFTCLALWIFGGGAIADLAFVLTIGIVTGTYSSIFIAAPVILGFSNPDKKARK